MAAQLAGHARPRPCTRSGRLALGFNPRQLAPPCLWFPSPPLQVAFVFATIREKNTSLPMPAAAASLMARGWDWLGASTPLRGPAMFSSDFIAELQVRAGQGPAGPMQPCRWRGTAAVATVRHGELGRLGRGSLGCAPFPLSRHAAAPAVPRCLCPVMGGCQQTRSPQCAARPASPRRATIPCPPGCWALSTWT